MSINKLKTNLLTMIIVIFLFIIISTIIYFIHRSFFTTNTHEAIYTYSCPSSNCDYDSIDEVYNSLNVYMDKNGTTNSVIDSIVGTYHVRLSTEEVESAVQVKLKNNMIYLTVSNKDTQIATLLYNTEVTQNLTKFEQQENIQLSLVDVQFNQSPIYTNYLNMSLLLGAFTGLFLIASDLPYNKWKIKLPKKNKSTNNVVK